MLLCNDVSESDYVAPQWSSWWGVHARMGYNEMDNFHAQLSNDVWNKQVESQLVKFFDLPNLGRKILNEIPIMQATDTDTTGKYHI